MARTEEAGGTTAGLPARERLHARLARLDALDVIAVGMYVHLAVWGAWGLIQPSPVLLTGTGPQFSHLVTALVLGASVLGAGFLVLDQTREDATKRLDLELPVLLLLIAGWSTYVVVVWSVVSGHMPQTAPPTAAIAAVTITAVLVPLLVRLAVLLIDAVAVIRAARKAKQQGLTGGPP